MLDITLHHIIHIGLISKSLQQQQNLIVNLIVLGFCWWWWFQLLRFQFSVMFFLVNPALIIIICITYVCFIHIGRFILIVSTFNKKEMKKINRFSVFEKNDEWHSWEFFRMLIWHTHNHSKFAFCQIQAQSPCMTVLVVVFTVTLLENYSFHFFVLYFYLWDMSNLKQKFLIKKKNSFHFHMTTIFFLSFISHCVPEYWKCS